MSIVVIHCYIIDVSLYRRCDVNWNKGKYSPLHVAAKYVKAQNLKLLVQHGAGEYVLYVL